MDKRTAVPDGEEVKRLRTSQGLTQVALAHKAGVTTITITRVEAGAPCYLSTLTRIAAALGKKFDQITAPQAGTRGAIYLQRKTVNWGPLTDGCRRCFWACGTGLQAIANRSVGSLYQKQGVKDIKLILPYAEDEALSLLQLEAYNRVHHETKAWDDQVATARGTYSHFITQLRSVGLPADGHLRRYRGIMYSNITIIDNRAFIAFYDDVGNGDLSFTLEFDRSECQAGYEAVRGQFERMWEGAIPPKGPRRRVGSGRRASR